MTSEGRGGDRTFTVVLAVACLVLAALVIGLAIQNLGLKKELAASHGDGLPTLATGDVVAPLVLVDDGFRRYTLDWSSTSRTVLLVYTTTCPVCAETRPVWEAMAGRLAEDGGVRVVGIELDRPTEPGADAPATPALARPYPTYAIDYGPNEAFLQLVPYVPATVVIDAGGKVRDVHFGGLDDGAAEAIATAIEDRAR